MGLRAAAIQGRRSTICGVSSLTQDSVRSTPPRPDFRDSGGVAVTARVALDAYLSPRQKKPDGLIFESSFAALLRDARGITGRDPNTGALPRLEAYNSRSWLGALSYLCLLDQIGTTVRPKRVQTIPRATSQPPAFTRCLQRFAGAAVLSPADQNALYGLRCALAHDYSLVNMGGDGRERRSPKVDKTHAFNFTCDATSELITHASSAWRRSTWTPAKRQTTVINFYELGNLAEAIVAEVRGLHRATRLRINDEYVRSARELLVRYGLTYWESTALTDTAGG